MDDPNSDVFFQTGLLCLKTVGCWDRFFCENLAAFDNDFWLYGLDPDIFFKTEFVLENCRLLRLDSL